MQHCSLHFHNYIDNPTRLFSNLYLVKFLDIWAQNRSFLYRRHTFHDRALSGNNERSRRERVVHRFRRNYSSHVSVEREKEKRRSYPSVAVCDSTVNTPRVWRVAVSERISPRGAASPFTLGQVRTQNRIASINDARHPPSLHAIPWFVLPLENEARWIGEMTDRSRWSRNCLEEKSSATSIVPQDDSPPAIGSHRILPETETSDRRRRYGTAWHSTARHGTAWHDATAPWVNLVLSALRERRLIRSL